MSTTTYVIKAVPPDIDITKVGDSMHINDHGDAIIMRAGSVVGALPKGRWKTCFSVDNKNASSSDTKPSENMLPEYDIRFIAIDDESHDWTTNSDDWNRYKTRYKNKTGIPRVDLRWMKLQVELFAPSATSPTVIGTVGIDLAMIGRIVEGKMVFSGPVHATATFLTNCQTAFAMCTIPAWQVDQLLGDLYISIPLTTSDTRGSVTFTPANGLVNEKCRVELIPLAGRIWSR